MRSNGCSGRERIDGWNTHFMRMKNRQHRLFCFKILDNVFARTEKCIKDKTHAYACIAFYILVNFITSTTAPWRRGKIFAWQVRGHGFDPRNALSFAQRKIEMLRVETCENRVYPIISFNSQSERVVIYIILMTLVYLFLVPTSSHEPRQAQFPSCTWYNAGAGQTKGWNSDLPMRLAPAL